MSDKKEGVVLHPHTVALAAIERSQCAHGEWTGCPIKCLGGGDEPCPADSVIVDNLCHSEDCAWLDARRAVAEHQSAGMDELVSLSEELGLYDSEDTP